MIATVTTAKQNNVFYDTFRNMMVAFVLLAWAFSLESESRADAFLMAPANCNFRYTSHATAAKSKTTRRMAGLFGEQNTVLNRNIVGGSMNTPASVDWIIYVDQSKASMDRGGGATLDAFCSLAPPSAVQIVPCLLPSQSYNKRKQKAPWIRCISVNNSNKSSNAFRNHLDVGNVDSVGKCYRVLTKHLQVEGVSLKTCEALKYKYMGNTFLEEGKIVSAIDAYQKALDRCDNNPKQRGVVLLLRASAYLQQAQTHQQILQKAVREWKLPQQPLLKAMLEDAIALSDTIKSSKKNSNTASISLDIMDKLASNGSLRTAQLRKIQYRHGLYQNSLLQAARDSLEATELLPNYWLSHKTAGECLVELWRIREARQYYEKAKRIMDKQQRSRDESNRSRASVEKSTASVMDGTDGEIGSDDNSKKKYDDSSNMDEIFRTLDIRQSILEEALNNPDWSIDSVRLALDVAV